MYLSPFGHETFPKANPLFFSALASASCLIYSPGSLYTSIIPCLALRSVGSAIINSPSIRARVLFLNSTRDRETPGYTALDFVEAIRSACAWRYDEEGGEAGVSAREVVSHVVYVEGAEVECEVGELERMGIECVACPAPPEGGKKQFDEDLVRRALGTILLSRAD